MGLLDDFLSGIGETYDTLSGNERIKQRAKGYGNAFQQGLLSALPILAKQPQDITPEDAINSGLLGAIKVFHGSPHKFDAFDMSKIGTGEGAQAYGHGLYFAENPEVAKSYSSAGGYKTDSPEKIASDLIGMYGGDIEKAVNHLTTILPDHGETTFTGQSRKLVESALASIKDGTYKNAESNLYKISLQWPDAAKETSDPLGPQHFLDWDKPLSEQPESVKSAWQSMFGDMPEPKGPLGRTLKGLMAEEDLKGQGIPGIRYLDGGSRGAGNGSYNYVVFDDQIPRIVKRNGLLE